MNSTRITTKKTVFHYKANGFSGLLKSAILLAMFVVLLPQTSFSQTNTSDVKLSISFKNSDLKQVLTDIEKKSDYVFMYDANRINTSQKVSIEITNESISTVLNKLFGGVGIAYSINGKQIALSNIVGREQSKSISGKVTDEKGLPIPGVTIVVKDTKQGTISDLYGSFSLTNVSGNATLVFTFVGMQTQEVAVGGKKTVNVVLEEEAIRMKEVVVTAFGINRETKQLTYVTQQVSGDKLSASGNSDVTKSLQGKIAGLTVRQVSGMPGETNNVTIRGSSSIAGNNSPIYVVDGFPVGSDVAFKINPNEIASVSVLKGASAAALYGLRASNGVIIINTKRGETNEMGKTRVSINSMYNFERMSIYPNMQKVYAQGENSVFNPQSAFSWGPRIDTLGTYINQLGEPEEARAYDNIRDFFRTGGNFSNNINVSNKFEKGNYSIGISAANQQGIIENTNNAVYTFKLSGDYKLSDKLTFSPTINYATNKSNQTSQSYGGSTLFYAAFNTPPSYNLKGNPTHEPDNEYKQINFRTSHDNIYWARQHNKQIDKESSLIGSIGLNYKLTSWMELNYKFGLNEQSSALLQVYELGSGETGGRNLIPSGGSIKEQMVRSRDLNSNLNMIIKKKFAKVLDFDFLLGHEFYDMNYDRLTSNGSGFVLGGFHSLANVTSATTGKTTNTQRSYALFSNLNLGYKDMLFLNVSGRRDVVSNMPRDNRAFFYPSVGTGFIFTELFKQKSKILSFGKIRASYAEVGQAGPIFATNQVYLLGNAFTFPFQGVTSFRINPSIASHNLMPENTKSQEYGLSLNFLDNRIKVDYAYFSSVSEGQILNVPIPASTGYTNEMMNAGEMSSTGHEVVLNLTLVKSKDVTWDLTTNFSTYTNRVVKLAPGITQLGLGGFRVGVVAEPGQEYPVIRGSAFAKDPATGKMVVDSRQFQADGVTKNLYYGMPLKSTESSVVLGKVNPDFEINFISTLRYKNFSLLAQIDWRQGGKMYSGSNRLSTLYGTHPSTLNRDVEVVEDAVKGYFDQTGKLIVEGNNDIVIKRGYDYYRGVMDNISESSLFDASFIRLREVRFEYEFPAKMLRNMPFNDLSLFVAGNNLWIIKSGLPEFDPEMGGTSSSNFQGEEYVRYPQISSYGLGINLKF